MGRMFIKRDGQRISKIAFVYSPKERRETSKIETEIANSEYATDLTTERKIVMMMISEGLLCTEKLKGLAMDLSLSE